MKFLNEFQGLGRELTTVSIDTQDDAFDDEGNRVDLEKSGFAVTTVTTVPESQLNDDCTQDISFYTHSLSQHPTFWLQILKQQVIAQSISATQGSGLPDIPSDDSVLEAAIAEETQASIATATQGNIPSGSVITVPSGESNAKKWKMLSKETESDFLEDHLLQVLDTGKFINVMCKPIVFFQQILYF